MASFRTIPLQPKEPWQAQPAEKLYQVLDHLFQPAHFFVGPDLDVTWTRRQEETLPWELFRGRLLETAQCRDSKAFLSWKMEGTQAAPMLACYLDSLAGEVHVVRGIFSHAWEAYQEGNAMLTREAQKWLRELVATVKLSEFSNLEELRDELICQLWHAVVGTSRLPLTSLEAPLPAFALGQFYFVCRSGAAATGPITSPEELLSQGLHGDLCWREQAKLLETGLRGASAQDAPRLADAFVHRWREIGRPCAEIPRLLRTLFNEVSLSPYTPFVGVTLAWLEALVDKGHLSVEEQIDFLGSLLRQEGRHLTAYDLVLFHHRGANYPDALLLDAVLREYLQRAQLRPDLFSRETADDSTRRLRRRALRQGCLFYRLYEGHLVPDAPTSPGENSRVLPAPFERVPEEQLLQPQRRKKQLFADAPLKGLLTPATRGLLQQSIEELSHDAELAELGHAVFIDRPFGEGKLPGEPDRTPLLAHLAFSPTIAQRRLLDLQRLAEEMDLPVDAALWPELGRRLREQPPTRGLSLDIVPDSTRPTVSLADARRVAEDFVVVRTLAGSLREAWPLLPVEKTNLDIASPLILTRIKANDGENHLGLFDDRWELRVHMVVDLSHGFASRAGVEYPRAGIRIVS